MYGCSSLMLLINGIVWDNLSSNFYFAVYVLIATSLSASKQRYFSGERS